MSRYLVQIFLTLAAMPTAAFAQEPKKGDLSKKPMYERMLKGEDAKRAADLQKRIVESQEADKCAESVQLAEELLALRVRVQGDDHWEVTTDRFILAAIRTVAALSAEERAKDRASWKDDRDAFLLERQIRYELAFPMRERRLAWCSRVYGVEHPVTATCYYFSAYNLELRGKLSEAWPLYQKALEIRRKVLGEDHPETLQCQNRIAIMMTAQGKCADAGPSLQKVLDIRRRVLGEDNPHTGGSYLDLAVNLGRQGKYVEATSLLQRNIDVWRKTLGENHPGVGSSMVTMASNLHALGRYDAAEPLLRNALEINLKGNGEGHPHTGKNYSALAQNLQGQRNFAEADSLYRKALEIIGRALGEEHPDTAAAYSNLAVNLNAQGRYIEAGPHFQRALDIDRKALGEYHRTTFRNYDNQAMNLLALGEYPKARELLLASCRSYEVARLDIASGGLDRAAMGARGSPYRALCAACVITKQWREAWAAAEADSSRGLLDELATRRGSSITDEERSAQERSDKRVMAIQSRIVQLVSRPVRSGPEAGELESLQAERIRLNEDRGKVAASISRREVATLEEVQSSMPDDAAFLYWLDFPDKTGQLQERWGCVIRSAGDPKWIRLPGTGPENIWTAADGALPFEFRQALATRPDLVAELGARLHTQRVSPLLPHLDGVKKLYCVSVQVMAGVPVEVLARDFTVSYIPSCTFIAKLKGTPAPKSEGVFAVGDPVYDLDKRKSEAVQAGLRGRSVWSELPGTRLELKTLRDLFPGKATLLADDDASESNVEKIRKAGELAKFRYLHFAGHGDASDVRAFESSLILSQNDPGMQEFAQIGEPWINGQVSAREVLDHWKLDAELVTLSACSTGVGRQGGGDGILGFAQAFLLAGSRSVCLSLWEVDDRATALLMDRFYRNLLGKREGIPKPMPKAEALSEAKHWLRELTADEVGTRLAGLSGGVSRAKNQKPLELVAPKAEGDPKQVKPFDHPRFWAAFILIGDPN